MAVQVSYPGVYVQEVPSGVRTITGVSTSVTMFLGMANDGPLSEPRRILSFADFERTFGTDVTAGEMTDQVRQFFLNGGRQAYVTRIANGAAAADAFLQDEFGDDDVLELHARSAGAVGATVRIRVDYDTASPESTFNLTAFREVADPNGVLQAVETERFTDLTMRPSSASYAVDVLNLRSGLLTATAAPTPPAPIQGYSQAGVLMDTGGTGGIAELTAALAEADSVTNTGRFQISVDGAAFVVAEVSSPADSSTSEINAHITVPVNAALAPTGKQITAEVVTFAGFNALRLTSASPDGSVRIAPALTRDIAVRMQLGVGQGGIEVDGYAVQRPAPSAFFSVLGTSLAALDALESFVGTDPDDVAAIEVTDASPVSGPHSANTPDWPAPGGTSMAQGSLTAIAAESLRNVQENLDYLARQINGSDIPWRATRAGFRIHLAPEFGGADADLTASIATTAGTDLGAAGEIFGQGPNVSAGRLGAPLPSPYQTAGTPGANGSFPVLGDYTGAFDVIRREVDLFNIMVLPRAAGQSDDDRAQVWQAASTFCKQQRAFLLVDPRSDWLDINHVTAGIGGLRIGLVADHAALYWPRLSANTPEGSQRVVDPSGSLAGLMARIDGNRGVWKAPAGIEATIRGVRAVEHSMSDSENGVINPEAVNAIRVFPNGIVSWGARTVDGFDNSGNNDYKYVPVRRLALFIEESLYRGLKFAVFEPNDEPLWAQIRLAAGAFMNNLFRQSAFQGQKKSDAYFVKVDSETTTQNDINLGIVNVVVGFAPLRPAEFVVITLQQMAGQIEV